MPGRISTIVLKFLKLNDVFVTNSISVSLIINKSNHFLTGKVYIAVRKV